MPLASPGCNVPRSGHTARKGVLAAIATWPVPGVLESNGRCYRPRRTVSSVRHQLPPPNPVIAG
jgi:hypothetical protein